jgi:glucose/mannose-6-phosphate isomerase
VEGWSAGAGAPFAALVLRHAAEEPEIAERVAPTLEAVAPSGLAAREVRAGGETPFEILFGLIMLGDFTSIYHALARGVDPTPVPVLTALKGRLGR